MHNYNFLDELQVLNIFMKADSQILFSRLKFQAFLNNNQVVNSLHK